MSEQFIRWFATEAEARRYAATHGLVVIPGPGDGAEWAAVDKDTAADFEAGKGDA